MFTKYVYAAAIVSSAAGFVGGFFSGRHVQKNASTETDAEASDKSSKK